MNKKVILFTLMLGGSVVGIMAQRLTLRECIDKALEHNKSLSAAKLKLEQTRYDMKSYKANFFPTANLMATDFYSTAQGAISVDGGHLPIYKFSEQVGGYVPSVTVAPDGSYRLNEYADFPSQKMKWKLENVIIGGVSLREPLDAGGKITAAYEMSKQGVSMADENIRLTEAEVVVKTHEAYYLVIQAKELGDVARAYKAMLNELKKNVEGAFRHGMSTRNDMMKVQVKQNEAELNIQKADNGYRLACMNLCHITGMPLDSEIEVDALNADSQNDWVIEGGAVSSRPEASILEHKTELARQKVKLAKSDYLPNVAVGASYTYANAGELAGKRLLDDGALSVGVAVNVPLDFFGSVSNKVRSTKVAYQIAQLEEQDLNEQMQLELSQYRNQYEEARTELNLCKIAFEQANENMRLSKQQYEVGFETLSDYLETQAMWQQCNANMVNARCQQQLAYVRLLKAAGMLR